MKRLLLTTLLPLAIFAQDTTDPTVEGPKVIAEAFAKLSAALGEAISKSGPASALSVCSERAPQIAKEVSAAHGVTLRRATHKPRNPKNADGSRSFLAPIVLGNPLCLQCHGTPNQDIAPATLAAIQKLYPEDKATGFKLGDLRGLWRSTFPNSK